MYTLFFYDADLLTAPAAFDGAFARMPTARQDKVRAYRFARDQRLCLAAGVLLDDWLRTQGYTLATTPLATHADGKPYFPAHPTWHFSLSHAGRYAVLAVADQPIGVDIEQIRPLGLDIASRYFTPAEQAQLHIPADFFRMWTCKEAYVKAIGRGLQVGLQSFSVDLAGGCLADATAPFRFFQPQAPEGYAVGVCLQVGVAPAL